MFVTYTAPHRGIYNSGLRNIFQGYEKKDVINGWPYYVGVQDSEIAIWRDEDLGYFWTIGDIDDLGDVSCLSCGNDWYGYVYSEEEHGTNLQSLEEVQVWTWDKYGVFTWDDWDLYEEAGKFEIIIEVQQAPGNVIEYVNRDINSK